MAKREWDKLAVCVLLDLVGMASMLTGLSEWIDIVWAPLSAMVLQIMYGQVWYSGINFVEELIPFTDVIPTATLAWFNEEFDIVRL